MYADISFQRVSKVKAKAFLDLESTPFYLVFESTDPSPSYNSANGQVCFHLEDKVLAAALVEAINRVVNEHEANLQAAQWEAA